VAELKPIELATEIVTAFVSNNSLPRGELAAMIETVHAAVKRLAGGTEAAPAVIEAPAPAVSIRKSVTPEYLICLDDGKRFKSLRRHLATLGMTPEQYRAKWDLPSTYPMVAPNYAARRSELAKSIGLGQLREKSAADPLASSDTIKAPPSETANPAANEFVAAPLASVGTIKAPEPSAPPEVAAKRKPGRPRKT